MPASIDDAFGGDSSGGDTLGTVFGIVEGILGGSARTAREQPVLAAAVAAGIVGAIIGSILAGRSRRPTTPLEAVSEVAHSARKKARGLDLDLGSAGALPALLPPLMKLLGNPIVQTYLRRAISNAISSRFSERF